MHNCKLFCLNHLRFSACGRVIIDKVPSGLERVTTQRKVKITGAEITEVNTNDEGKFCVDVKPGKYIFQVKPIS